MKAEALYLIIRVWFIAGSVLYFGALSQFTRQRYSPGSEGDWVAAWIYWIVCGWTALAFLPLLIIVALNDLGFLEMPL